MTLYKMPSMKVEGPANKLSPDIKKAKLRTHKSFLEDKT